MDPGLVMDPYMDKALREARVNALGNTDYDGRRRLTVQKWPEYIQITNPGTFRISVQRALIGGVPDARNEVLRKMFSMIYVTQHSGSCLGTASSNIQTAAGTADGLPLAGDEDLGAIPALVQCLLVHYLSRRLSRQPNLCTLRSDRMHSLLRLTRGGKATPEAILCCIRLELA